MASSSAVPVPGHEQWVCETCTFFNPVTSSICDMCHTPKPAKKPKAIEAPKKVSASTYRKKVTKRERREVGRVIFQTERVTNAQMQAEADLHSDNSSVKTGVWRVFLFGDNDRDKGRLQLDKRQFSGGLASVCGRYDRTVACGIVTCWYDWHKPSFDEFRSLMDDQFDELFRGHLAYGRDVVVPSPSDADLAKSPDSYFEALMCRDGVLRKAQVVFHNIGTGIASLSLPFLKYIQFKVDTLERLSRDPATAKALAFGDEAAAVGFDDEVKMDDGSGAVFKSRDCVEVCYEDSWLFGTVVGAGRDGYIVQLKMEDGREVFPHVSADSVRPLKDTEVDEWEDANDFVFEQYLLDLKDMFDNPFSHLDEIMQLLYSMGVRSMKSKSRALEILEELKKKELERESRRKAEELRVSEELKRRYKRDREVREFEDTEIAKMLAEGRFMLAFLCPACLKEQKLGGVQLRACEHPICDFCFRVAVNTGIELRAQPKCPTCEVDFDFRDVHVHYDSGKAAALSEALFMQQLEDSGDLYRCFSVACDGYLLIEEIAVDNFVCPKCESHCCILCSKCHKKEDCPKKPKPPPPPAPVPFFGLGPLISMPMAGGRFDVKKRVEFLDNASFFGRWEHDGELASSSMCRAFSLQMGSTEYHNVISYVEDPSNRTVVKIQRIQNAALWRAYANYCHNTGFRYGVGRCEERAVWHGTRAYKPKTLYAGKGFDVSHARIGGCLWFAMRNTYSMAGFEHPCTDGSGHRMIFLALVACGHSAHCKLIRNSEILNVYKNEATYPAYLITYYNGGPGIAEQRGHPLPRRQ